MGGGWGWWLWSAAAALAWSSVSGEVYTSLVGLEKLLREESRLAASLEEYIAAEEERLAQIRQVLQSRASRKFLQDSQLEPSNPILAFTFIKNAIHLTANALGLVNGAGRARELVAAKLETRPEEADLDGAAAALFRIQDTYNLTAEEMAEGRLPGLPRPNASAPMSADDAFHLGYSAAQAFDFYHAVPWMAQALRKSREEDLAAKDPSAVAKAAPGELADLDRSFNDSLLFDYLAYSLYEQGNPEWATFYARALRDVDPSYPAVDNLAVYEDALRNASSTWDGEEASLPPLKNERDTRNAYLDYEKLCRGEEKTTEAQRKDLVCFLRRDSPFAFLAPLKAEVLHRRPDLLLFHEVLSEREVQHLQDIATPSLKRAFVFKRKLMRGSLRRAMVVKEEGEEEELAPRKLSGDSSAAPKDAEDDEGNIIASYRIAQNMWVEDNDDPVVERISRRVEALSGLTTEFAENLQIANYGIGGHYEPHYDMSTEPDPKGGFNEDHGNRIATALFYLNAPEAGGFTVFEELGLAVRPVARAAAFWMNVRREGSPDMLTRHAACPVLFGAKWVANKWLHEFGQERARPCHPHRGVLFDPVPPPVFSPREHRQRAPYHTFAYQTSVPAHIDDSESHEEEEEYEDEGALEPDSFHTQA